MDAEDRGWKPAAAAPAAAAPAAAPAAAGQLSGGAAFVALALLGTLSLSGCKGSRPSGSADGGAAPPPSASSAPRGLALTTRRVVSPDGVRHTVSSGTLRTFDGLPLAVDLTLPDDGRVGPRPLVVFFHGWGADKSNWESETVASSDAAHDGWNNVAFAARGYAVLNYSVRGWRESCGPSRAAVKLVQDTLDEECRSRAYWVHVADPRVEIRDAQALIAQLVDEGVADPARIGVTGGSYGGAHVWQLALLGDHVTMPDGTLAPWRSARGEPIRVAVAAPFYTWSSLVHALAPNGRAGDDAVPSREVVRRPVGVPLGTYLNGFFAGGPAMGNAFYAPPTRDPSADFTAWFARLSAGAPFVDDPVVDPVLARALDELERRSPLHAPIHGAVPVYQVQGFTDPLFPAAHALHMRAKLLAADPQRPIRSFFGDVGHDNAKNDRAHWDLAHGEARRLFDHVLLRAPAPASTRGVVAGATACLPGQRPGYLVADTWSGLATSSQTLRASEPHGFTNLSVSRASIAADPLFGGSGCRVVPAAHLSTTSWGFRVPEAVVAGSPRVVVRARFVGTDAEVHARLWDVAPSGDAALVSRGAYRWVAASRLKPELGVQEIATTLSANVWHVLSGHELRVEVVGNAAPELQASALPSTAVVESVELTIPVARVDALQPTAR